MSIDLHGVAATSGPPPLPLEVAQDVLLFLPLRFSLSPHIDPAARLDIHTQCASALNATLPTPQLYRAYVPRMLNGAAKLLSTSPHHVPLAFFDSMHRRGYKFPVGPCFGAALVHNRVDVLDWWVQPRPKHARLRNPYLRLDFNLEKYGRVYPMHEAIENGAWDALDWLAQALLPLVCHDAFTVDEMAALIRSRGQRQVKFAALWFRAGFVFAGAADKAEEARVVVRAACEMGYACVLEAYAAGRPQFDTSVSQADADAACEAAVKGCGPVGPLLDWMVSRRWSLKRVKEFANKYGNEQALQWCKSHAEQIGIGSAGTSSWSISS